VPRATGKIRKEKERTKDNYRNSEREDVLTLLGDFQAP
jgi:hypothetical protein